MKRTTYKLLILLACASISLQLSAKKEPEKDYLKLAEKAYDEYRFDDAAQELSDWEAHLKKKKKAVPAELGEMRSKVMTMQNMMQRVEKIAIIDSIVVDKDLFFTHYRLSAEAGKLFDASILPPQYSEQSPKVVFKPQSKGEVFSGMPDADGTVGIVSAQILDDGTFMQPTPLGDELNEGGDADYLYMMSDGMTFYFANDGDNSIGGYDIFLSRRGADGSVLQPQNLGFPYNSPYDDYMLVIDEEAGLGWWATDRNQIPDKVTIYVFVPNQIRVNYDPEDDNISNYAKISSIAATHDGNVDVDRLLNNKALQAQDGKNAAQEPTFMISMGNGKVYTSLGDFKSKPAAQAMRQYLDKIKDLELMKAQLSSLRTAYAQGDKSVADEILSLEKRVQAAYPALQRMRNQVVTLERKQ